VGLLMSGGDALPYRNRLNAGKYLVVVKGSDVVIRRAMKILRPLPTESLQNYDDVAGAWDG
jgi:hypothetical protein